MVLDQRHIPGEPEHAVLTDLRDKSVLASIRYCRFGWGSLSPRKPFQALNVTGELKQYLRHGTSGTPVSKIQRVFHHRKNTLPENKTTFKMKMKTLDFISLAVLAVGMRLSSP